MTTLDELLRAAHNQLAGRMAEVLKVPLRPGWQLNWNSSYELRSGCLRVCANNSGPNQFYEKHVLSSCYRTSGQADVCLNLLYHVAEVVHGRTTPETEALIALLEAEGFTIRWVSAGDTWLMNHES
jgi:hypothetical protein